MNLMDQVDMERARRTMFEAIWTEPGITTRSAIFKLFPQIAYMRSVENASTIVSLALEDERQALTCPHDVRQYLDYHTVDVDCIATKARRFSGVWYKIHKTCVPLQVNSSVRYNGSRRSRQPSPYPIGPDVLQCRRDISTTPGSGSTRTGQ